MHRTEEVKRGDANDCGGKRSRHFPRDLDLAHQRHKDHAKRQQSRNRVGIHFQHGQECDQRQARSADRAEERGPRQGPPHGVAEKRKPNLEYSHENGHGHAHLPRQIRVMRRQIRGAQNTEGHSEDARSIQAERHGRHIVAARLLREAARHPGIEKIAGEHADGCPWNHAVQDDGRRKAESAGQDAGKNHEIRDVIEHQGEEPVQVAGPEPAIARGHR